MWSSAEIMRTPSGGRQLFAGKERIPHDRYQWALVLAAACMVVELALRERRGRDVETLAVPAPGAKEAA